MDIEDSENLQEFFRLSLNSIPQENNPRRDIFEPGRVFFSDSVLEQRSRIGMGGLTYAITRCRDNASTIVIKQHNYLYINSTGPINCVIFEEGNFASAGPFTQFCGSVFEGIEPWQNE